MRVIIAGGRDFDDFGFLKFNCDLYLEDSEDNQIEIVSGKCSGADKLGERYAALKGFKVKEFPANWHVHGKKAGPLRNKEMAEYADMLIAFWDGKSKGTGGMIKLAEERNLIVHVIYYV